MSYYVIVLPGKATMKDPITAEEIPFYPFKYKVFKYTISFITFLFMVSFVFVDRWIGKDMLTLELSSYLLETPNDAYAAVSQFWLAV